MKYVDVTGEFWEEFLNGPKNIYTLGKELYRGIQKGTENFKLSEKGTLAVKESNQFSKDVQPVLEGTVIVAGTLSGGTVSAFVGSVTALEAVNDIEFVGEAITGKKTEEEVLSKTKSSIFGLSTKIMSLPVKYADTILEKNFMEGFNFIKESVLKYSVDSIIYNDHHSMEKPLKTLQFGDSIERTIKEIEKHEEKNKSDK